MNYLASSEFKNGGELHSDIGLSYVQSLQGNTRRTQVEGIVYHQVASTVFGPLNWPPWLKNGIANWVRLKAGFPCIHWNTKPGVPYQDGEGANAYFWDYFNDAADSNLPLVLGAINSGQDVDVACRQIGRDSLEHAWECYQNHLLYDKGSANPEFRFDDQGNSEIFNKCIPDPVGLLKIAYATAVSLLYSNAKYPVRRVKHVTLRLLPSMNGVANTGGDVISLSMPYVNGVASRNSIDRTTFEVTGVIVHEMVHVVQFDGGGKAPGGLIEGIADYVRLRAELAPPHWKMTRGGKWDSGYERTGYFLDWAQKKHPGFVEECNSALARKWDEGWCRQHCQRDWEELWQEYQESIKATGVVDQPALPTHAV